jgi:hypothetical protein
MSTDYAAVLSYLYKESFWSIGENYDSFVWESEGPKPSQAELDAAWPLVQYNRAVKEMRMARFAAYRAPDGPDSIYLQWQRGDATEQDWLDAVQAVKDAHPYPEAP